MNQQQVAAALKELPDLRAGLPLAYGDPAFVKCLHEAIAIPELVAQFDRLYGASLTARKTPIDAMVDEATGRQDKDLRGFAEFVHDAIYLRLPSEAIHAMRLSADKEAA